MILKLKMICRLFSVLVGVANCLSNRVSTSLVNLFTIIKVSALAFIIMSGIAKFSQGSNEALKTGMEGTDTNPASLASAIYSGLWAYGGGYLFHGFTISLQSLHAAVRLHVRHSCVI